MQHARAPALQYPGYRTNQFDADFLDRVIVVTGVLSTVTALLLSVAILLIGHGLQTTVVPLYADSLGWSREVIGYIGSAYFAGFVVGCLTIPRLVSRVGHIRVFGVLASTATAALLAVGTWNVVAVWIIARFVTGWCFAGLYMVIESWLNERTGAEQRGGVLSVYTIITLLAMCVGQSFIGFELDNSRLVMLGAILISLGTIPVGLTRSAAPAPIPAVNFRLKEVYRVSQVAVVGAFCGGFVTGGFWSLGPVVAKAQHLSSQQIGLFMAVTILGGAIFQMPIGRLSDYADRRLVILGIALLGLGVCIAAPFATALDPRLLFMLMFVFGGVSFPMYSLCLAHANDNTQLPLMDIASVILLMNSVGSVFGPLVVSHLLAYTDFGLFIVAGVVLGALAAWTAWRVRLHSVARRFFTPFVSMPRTTPSVAEMLPEDDSESLSRP